MAELTYLSRGHADDKNFFTDHPDRRARIRLPFRGEHEKDFQRLGFHAEDRRRILVLNHPNQIMQIPYLLFSDDSVGDNDETLMPLIDECFRDAARYYNMDTPIKRL